MAFAQSSVTLYGVIDAGINYVSNARTGSAPGGSGASQVALTSGPMQGSRWGFLGAEDLGGGYKAIFQLENGFTVNNGVMVQGGDEFGRLAYVGLSGPLGSITLGRQNDMLNDFVSPIVANRFAGYFAAHPDDLDNLNQTFRVNNSIKYTSNVYHGLSAGAIYGFGGVAGSFARNQIFSLGLHYAAGPIELGVAYDNVRNPNISAYGNNANGGGAAVNNIGANSPVMSGYASASTLQIIAAGGAYTFGALTFDLAYTNTQFRGLGDRSTGPNPNHYTGNATFHNAEVGMRYRIRPDLFCGASYNFTHGTGASNVSGVNYNQFNLALDYLLSKRTDVYALAGYQSANGHDSTSATLPAVASLTNITPAAIDHQAVVRIGLRHKF
jgi:predicted porin